MNGYIDFLLASDGDLMPCWVCHKTKIRDTMIVLCDCSAPICVDCYDKHFKEIHLAEKDDHADIVE